MSDFYDAQTMHTGKKREKTELRSAVYETGTRSLQYRKALKDVFSMDEKMRKMWTEEPLFGINRQYDYLARSQMAQNAGLPTDTSEVKSSQLMQAISRPELTKEEKKALRLEKEVQLMEGNLLESRTLRLSDKKTRMVEGQEKEEERLLKKKMEAIDQSLTAALEKEGLTEEAKLDLEILAAQDRIRVQAEYAHMFPVGSEIRRDALDRKEELELTCRDLKKDMEILRLKKQGRAKEAERESSSRFWHGLYEKIRKLRPSQPDTSLSKEDATFENPYSEKMMVNRGRAFFGGTKPMYVFEEEGVGGKTLLYKEAVNCTGGITPERAYVTACAASMQRYLFGKDHYVPVFVAKNKKGTAIGSFQYKVDTLQTPTAQIPKIDLYAWQEEPSQPISEEVTRQILREHTLDWVLGNFDTKGENFLQRTDGSLVSIDKEASFSHLGEEKAQHMSRTEILQKHNTIYNVLFSQFVERPLDSKDPIFLDFDYVETYIEKIENIPADQYLVFFEAFLTEKYGAKIVDGKENEERKKAEGQILAIKNGLRDEYKRFFGQLLDERLKLIDGKEPAYTEFMKHYLGHYTVSEEGVRYLFPSERGKAKKGGADQ